MVKRNAIATQLTKRCTKTQKQAFDDAVCKAHPIQNAIKPNHGCCMFAQIGWFQKEIIFSKRERGLNAFDIDYFGLDKLCRNTTGTVCTQKYVQP